MLFRRPRPAVDINRFELEPLSVEAVARELKLRKRAASNGSAGLPRATDRNLDGPQAEIVQYVEKHVATNLTRVQGGVLDIRRRLDDALRRDPVEMVEEVQSDALRNLRRIAADLALSRKRARAVADETAARLRRFRLEHGLQRPAVYPRSRVLAWGRIFFLTTAEGVMNAYYFMLGSDLGLLGGVATSFVFAFFDLFVCITAGRLMTRATHRNWLWRIPGCGAVVTALVWVPGWALTTGHLREALQVTGDDLTGAWSLARTTIAANPLGLEQLESWALVVIGLAISAGGVLAGWRLDDPYPGYGAITREDASAQEEHAELASDLQRQLTAVEDAARDALRRLVSEREASIGAIGGYRRTLEGIHDAVRTFTDQVTRSTNALLRLYRDENSRYRPGGAVPEYFDTEYSPTLPQSFEMPQPPPDPDRDEWVARRLRTAKELAAQARDSIHDEVQRLSRAED